MSDWDFRHAVVLSDQDGRSLPHTPYNEALAHQLLEEWGCERGGKPVSSVVVETWDWGSVVGYAMNFKGAYRPPIMQTRLRRWVGVSGTQLLRNNEEWYIVHDEP